MTAYLEYIPAESDLCLVCRETTQTQPWVAHEDQDPNYNGRSVHPLHRDCAISWFSHGHYFCTVCRTSIAPESLNVSRAQQLIVEVEYDTRPFTGYRCEVLATAGSVAGLCLFLTSLNFSTQQVAMLNLGLTSGVMSGLGLVFNNNNNAFHSCVAIKTLFVAFCLLATNIHRNITSAAFLVSYGLVINLTLLANDSFAKKATIGAMVGLACLTHAYVIGLSSDGIRDFGLHLVGGVVGAGFGARLYNKIHRFLD